MAKKEIIVEELIEVLYQWHHGRNISQIKRSLGLDRKTIRKYLALAEQHGFVREDKILDYRYYLELASKIQGSLVTPLESSQAYKTTALYQSVIEKLLSKKFITAKQTYRILKREHEYPLSYSSFKRYMHIQYPKQPDNCLRIEVKAAEEAQVDFGSGGLMYDSEAAKMRRAHVFVMVLSYSRLPYVEFVFDQGQVTWVNCHINAFTFFKGVPERIVLDNLKSGILKPNTYDPVFNRAYAECAKHYGFIIDPAKIRKAEHKGKVERKIIVIRQQFLSSYDFRDISQANEKVRQWSIEDYGMELHGTTRRRPSDVFFSEEQQQLKELPLERFDMPLWKEAKVHPDHHIVFDKNYYSLPTRYVGKKVWVRGGIQSVRIFYDGQLIKSHPRTYRQGIWQTDETDYPPQKSLYLMKSTEYYQQQASEHGKYVRQIVAIIMTEHAYRNLRKVQALFRLAGKYGSEALNLACQRCIFYEDYRMNTVKRILQSDLYKLPLEQEAIRDGSITSEGLLFVRPAEYFMHKEGKHTL